MLRRSCLEYREVDPDSRLQRETNPGNYSKKNPDTDYKLQKGEQATEWRNTDELKNSATL